MPILHFIFQEGKDAQLQEQGGVLLAIISLVFLS